MNVDKTFGSIEPEAIYTQRVAAYVVIIEAGKIAAVCASGKCFLPGGGSLNSEAATETIIREVREELSRSVRLTVQVGTAIQYFFSEADNRHYKMFATFFAGEFLYGEAHEAKGEHEMCWIPTASVRDSFFHECHTWAIFETIRVCRSRETNE